MLVLTRKAEEKIVIDGDIIITVLRLSPGRCRIGIEAPKHIAVVREELLRTSLVPVLE